MTNYTGGCQCGSVRYSVEQFGRASICHCRMCQKAFGAFFAPLVEVHNVSWTKGERAIFRSSEFIKRGFCKKCGTPLTYEHDGGMEIAIGSLDNPDVAAPEVQVNIKSQRACFNNLNELPPKTDQEQLEDERWNAKVISNQHPDHD